MGIEGTPADKDRLDQSSRISLLLVIISTSGDNLRRVLRQVVVESTASRASMGVVVVVVSPQT